MKVTATGHEQGPLTDSDSIHAAPSWCPHFLWQRTPMSFPLCWNDFNEREQMNTASGSTSPKIQIHPQSPNQMIVTGSLVDSVAAVQCQLCPNRSNYDEFVALREFCVANTTQNSPTTRKNAGTRKAVQMTIAAGSLPAVLTDINQWDALEIALRVLQIPEHDLP